MAFWVWLIKETSLFYILCQELMTLPTRLKDPNIFPADPYLERGYMSGTLLGRETVKSYGREKKYRHAHT